MEREEDGEEKKEEPWFLVHVGNGLVLCCNCCQRR